MQTIAQHIIELDGKSGSPNKKFDCPGCGHRKRFRRYYNYETKQYIGDNCGLCDRQRCGYHLTPKEYFALNPNERPAFSENWKFQPTEQKQLVHIPFELLEDTWDDYDNNSFIKPLTRIFSKQKIERAIGEYALGTITAFSVESQNHRSVTFPFIDKDFNVRAIQAKLFDQNLKTQGITIGDREVKAYWIHKILKRQCNNQGKPIPQWLIDYETTEKVTCLFGEHLLSKYPNKPIALVEAPKSAVLASMVYEDYVWLATSSLSYLTKSRCSVLKGREVFLIPDCGVPNPKTGMNCLELWQERVKEFSTIANFHFSTLLEERTTEEQKIAGFDIADLILEEAFTKGLSSSKDISHNDKIQLLWEDIFLTGTTQTSSTFDHLYLASIWTKGGDKYRVLYSKDGMPVVNHPQIDSLSKHFGLRFLPGILNIPEPPYQLNILINIANN